jgi:hypothetical protein
VGRARRWAGPGRASASLWPAPGQAACHRRRRLPVHNCCGSVTLRRCELAARPGAKRTLEDAQQLGRGRHPGEEVQLPHV